MLRPSEFAFDPSDSDEIRRQKSVIFVVAGSCCLAGVVWTAMYALTLGMVLTTALPAAFVVIVGAALLLSHATRNHGYAVYAQIVCIMYVTAAIQWSIGGLFDSGFVLAWAFCGPVTALLFFPLRKSIVWFVLYLVNLGITVVFDDAFQSRALAVEPGIRQLFFAMNLSCSSAVVFVFGTYFVQTAASERKRAEGLQHDLDATKAKQLGPYTLEQKLGAGGMGVVYQARHALLRRNTAIKLLPSGVADELRFKRFEREVQLTSELSHPNIVAIYDYGRSPEGEFYYAMEHLPGVDLETLVEQQGPLEAARAVPILRQVADALDAAHFRGLIHRDIKPANVILSRFGRRTDVVKVLDFGLVKGVDESTSLTMEKSICGTPAYLAPEALTAPDEVGVSTDIYALGALGFFLVTGTTVFPGRTVAEVCGHHIHTPAPAPSSATEIEVPPDLDAFVLRCLAKKPVDRFPSAAAVRDALESIASPTTWDPDRAREWWDEYEIRRSKAPPANPVSRDTMTIAPRA